MSGSRWLVSIHSLAYSSHLPLVLHPRSNPSQPLVSRDRLNLSAHGPIIPGIRFRAATILFPRDIWKVGRGVAPRGGTVTAGLHSKGCPTGTRGVLAGLAV
jgi:hypothetical protein